MSDLLCPSCDSPKHNLVFTSWNGYPIRRCESCRLVFTDDREAPPPETLYPHFEQSDNVARKNVRSALSVFSDQRAAVVERMSKRPAQHDGTKKRLLDYGCGSGAFARFMAGRGYDVVGLEPFSLGSPTNEPSLTLLRKPFESARAELGTFDVITLWHVLEHVHKPIELLRALGEHLAPDGVIVISVPNFKSVQSELFKGAWFHLDPPRHLIHFEPDTLTSTVEHAGLRQVAEAAVPPRVRHERLGAERPEPRAPAQELPLRARQGSRRLARDVRDELGGACCGVDRARGAGAGGLAADRGGGGAQQSRRGAHHRRAPCLTREVPRAFGIALLASAVLGVVIIPSRGHYRADSMVLVFAALGVVVWLLVDSIRRRQTEVRTRARRARRPRGPRRSSS